MNTCVTCKHCLFEDRAGEMVMTCCLVKDRFWDLSEPFLRGHAEVVSLFLQAERCLHFVEDLFPQLQMALGGRS